MSPGAFDIVCELIPHIAIILYRIYPSNHLFLSRLFLFAAISTFFGTICETIVIFYLFGSLWDRWQLAFKIVTPLLHVAFSATQLHGSRIFYCMWKKQCRILAGEGSGEVRVEGMLGGRDARPVADDRENTTEEKRESVTITDLQAGRVV